MSLQIALEKYFVSITGRNYVDSMETVCIMIRTFYGDFLVNLIWRFTGNMIYYAFSTKILNNPQANFIIKSP